jgi:peptide/nickel transport system substrate-binding protein
MQDDRINELIEQARTFRYDRRQILKRAAVLGLSAPAISVVLAACGGDDDDDEPEATQPPAAPDPTAVPDDDEDEETPEPEDEDDDDEEPAEPDPTATPEDDDDDDAEPTTPPADGVGGGILNLPITTGDSGVGNPILTGPTAQIPWQVFNRLMTYDDVGTLQPELAESWEFSDDNMELTLHLAEATWHDGEPFDAEDVIFTFETIQDENTDTFLRSRLQVGGEYVTWEAVDPRTIVLTMVEPFAPLLFNLNQIPIIPEHVLAGESDINTSDFNRNPIGTGSFRMVEWVPDQFFRLERFDDHFRGPALADGITCFFLADSTAARASLEAGEIDMFFAPPEAQAPFMDNPDYNLHRYVYFTSITLAFNHSHPLLQDFTVRKAIEHAIDKDSLTETVTRGLGIVSHNQFAETGPLDRYNDYDNVPPSVYDPDEANRMLDEAGYALGDDGIRVGPDGERFEFPILTYSGFDEYLNAQVILQEMLREVGIDIIPTVVEYTTLEGLWADPEGDPRERALEIHEWPHPFEFDPDLFNELHSSNHPPGQNYMWFADDVIDDLIERGRTETDPEERVSIYRQIDVRRSETLPTVPLYLAVDAWVTNLDVLGPDGEPIQTPYFRRAVFTSTHTWWKQT